MFFGESFQDFANCPFDSGLLLITVPLNQVCLYDGSMPILVPVVCVISWFAVDSLIA